jgi:GDSL-like Lipase/Acylhydrolase family
VVGLGAGIGQRRGRWRRVTAVAMGVRRAMGIVGAAALVTATGAAASGAAVEGKADAGSRPAVVVAVGDSLISGVAGRWAGNSLEDSGSRDGTDRACTPGPTPGSCATDDPAMIYGSSLADSCLRSDSAEVMSARIPGVARINLACSGATTANVRPRSDGGQSNHGEAPQVDQLASVARKYRVRMIVMSIGLNDMNFSNVIIQCGYRFGDDHGLALPHGDCKGAEQTFLAAAPRVPRAIERVVDDIRRAMRKRGYASDSYRIVLQSVPTLLPRAADLRYPEQDVVDRVNQCPFYDADVQWIRTTAMPLLASVVKQAAAAKHAEFLDVLNLFAGHEICSAHDGLVTAAGPASAKTSEWGRFVSLSHAALQGATADNPLLGVDEIYHPSYFGQLALGLCLRQVAAAPPGVHTCTSVPGAGVRTLTNTIAWSRHG